MQSSLPTNRNEQLQRATSVALDALDELVAHAGYGQPSRDCCGFTQPETSSKELHVDDLRELLVAAFDAGRRVQREHMQPPPRTGALHALRECWEGARVGWAWSQCFPRRKFLGLFVMLLALSGAAASVRAEDSVCDATWSERLATARNVIATRTELTKLGRTGFAAAQFYGTHCRDLSRLERAVRKADDVNAFVCEPEAGRVPALLTPRFTRDWLSHFGAFPDADAQLAVWLREAIAGVEIIGAAEAEQDNAQCADVDVAAGRIALTLDAVTPVERLLAEQSVLVYGCSKRSCDEARAQIAAVRAKLAL